MGLAFVKAVEKQGMRSFPTPSYSTVDLVRSIDSSLLAKPCETAGHVGTHRLARTAPVRTSDGHSHSPIEKEVPLLVFHAERHF